MGFLFLVCCCCSPRCLPGDWYSAQHSKSWQSEVLFISFIIMLRISVELVHRIMEGVTLFLFNSSWFVSLLNSFGSYTTLCLRNSMFLNCGKLRFAYQKLKRFLLDLRHTKRCAYVNHHKCKRKIYFYCENS